MWVESESRAKDNRETRKMDGSWQVNARAKLIRRVRLGEYLAKQMNRCERVVFEAVAGGGGIESEMQAPSTRAPRFPYMDTLSYLDHRSLQSTPASRGRTFLQKKGPDRRREPSEGIVGLMTSV
jgi:hypothetical protein